MAHVNKTLVLPIKIKYNGESLQNTPDEIILSTVGHNEDAVRDVVVLDYGRVEGGMPVFEISKAHGHGTVVITVAYSETADGINCVDGDGPFFLFSNAMDTYRSAKFEIEPSKTPLTLRPFFAQRSQRYLRINLCSPDSTITFSRIGFDAIRPARVSQARFHCSDPLLNQIWTDGLRTVDMCSLERGETKPAWEPARGGMRVRGQHWAPCRWGTRWTEKVVTFDVFIEQQGASWGVHMVANGLVFCLNKISRALQAFEGLADRSSVFPSTKKAEWSIPDAVNLDDWITVRVEASSQSVEVWLSNIRIGMLDDVAIHPILGGSLNSGSIAFGGPLGWIAIIRQLHVHTLGGEVLYENDMSTGNHQRTLDDFQVGTNSVACMVDGAKRDRACFGGDLFVSGRSVAYGGMDMDVVRGTIELLASHQTQEGYLGNLCSAQAAICDSSDEPPSYAFYSLTYALQLVVSAKNYWLHSRDQALITKLWPAFKKLQEFVQSFRKEQGLVEAPPPLSMTWFPMGGPVFGASASLNLAYYDNLLAMSILAPSLEEKVAFEELARNLKQNLVKQFWNESTGIFRMSHSLPEEGKCQDAIAYAATLGIIPEGSKWAQHLTEDDEHLPCAFRDLNHWGKINVVSPYATGFAGEALFARSFGNEALQLIRRVWGVMADRSSPDYSGCHWEALRPDGKPFNHDVSLVHAWSTMPVSLLPQYLAGLRSVGPGWSAVQIAPVVTEVKTVEYQLSTCKGEIAITIRWSEEAGCEGVLSVALPDGIAASIIPPTGYASDVEELQGPVSNTRIILRSLPKDRRD